MIKKIKSYFCQEIKVFPDNKNLSHVMLPRWRVWFQKYY